jgi:hypothetical protein
MTTNEQPQYVTESFQRARKKLTPEVAGLSIVETYTMVWLCLDKLADFRSPAWFGYALINSPTFAARDGWPNGPAGRSISWSVGVSTDRSNPQCARAAQT